MLFFKTKIRRIKFWWRLSAAYFQKYRLKALIVLVIAIRRKLWAIKQKVVNTSDHRQTGGTLEKDQLRSKSADGVRKKKREV